VDQDLRDIHDDRSISALYFYPKQVTPHRSVLLPGVRDPRPRLTQYDLELGRRGGRGRGNGYSGGKIHMFLRDAALLTGRVVQKVCREHHLPRMAIPRGPWNIAILILSMAAPAPTRAAIWPPRMLSVEVHINLIRTHIVDAERKLHRTEGGVHTFIEAVVAQRTAETGAGDVSRHAVLLVAVTEEDYCPQGIARPWTDCAEGHMPCWQRASRFNFLRVMPAIA